MTLGLWNAMPFYYPCFTSESNIPRDKLMRKKRIIQMLKKITKAAGGDLVVITSLGELKTVTIDMGSMPTDLEMFAAEGYAVKMKHAPKVVEEKNLLPVAPKPVVAPPVKQIELKTLAPAKKVKPATTTTP